MSKCDHYWSYPNAIWEGRNDQEIAVGRYCGKCGTQQCAFAHEWGLIPKGYVHMREVLRAHHKDGG